MDEICLDRLLKQRFALRKICIPLDCPPQRGEIKEFVGRGGLLCSGNHE